MKNRQQRRAAEKAARTRRTPATSIAPEDSRATDAELALRQGALQHYQAGRFAEADRLYKQLIRSSPSDADALFQYGVLKGQVGEFDPAEKYLTRAAALRPREAAFHHALGLVRMRQRRFADAIACQDRALALDPSNLGALLGRGEALHQLGDVVAAEATYRLAARSAPGEWGVRFCLATAVADLGRLPEAAAIYRELLGIRSNSAEAHFNFGCVLRDLGRPAEAAVHFDQAVALKPELDHMVIDLVAVLCEIGRTDDALERALTAMRRRPQTSTGRLAFASAIARAGALDYRPEISLFLAQCLETEDVEHEDIAAAAARQLVQKYRLGESPAEAAAKAVASAIASNGAEGFLADPLLHLLLIRAVNYDLTLEVLLTEIRRRLALNDEAVPGLERFLAALALQSFNNGYVFRESGDETRRISALKPEIESELLNLTHVTPALQQKILRYSLYAPLMEITGAARLLAIPEEPGSAPLRLVVDRCVKEPLEEAEIARALPRLGDIADSTSREVQAQYEEHSYPRWFSTPPLAPVSLPIMLKRKFPHAPVPASLTGPIEILVAGCGTGRQPIGTATSFSDVRVLGVDLSRASLAYASRMARKLGVSNVSFLQADLLELGAIGRRFPMIEAVGVLHHLDNPIAGWRVLCELLTASGFMRIGLYSALARADVARARERIGQLGLTRSAGDIRRFRQSVLFDTEAGRFPSLALSKDMHDLNGCRDLLFHAREHCYGLEEIGAMLAALGLEFVGFELATDAMRLRYRAENAADPAMTDLARWAQFEAAHPDAFSSMYVFWCRKTAEG